MRTWNIAHRGGAQARPENSLAAFGYAATCGYDGVELDVQLSRDGEVVVFHDYRLKPEICRDGSGDLASFRPTPTPRSHRGRSLASGGKVEHHDLAVA